MAFFHAGMNFLRDFYYLLVVAGGVWLIYTHRIEVVDLLSFILYVGIILPPIDRLIQFMEQYQQGTASFERFIEIMDEAPEIQDKNNARELKTTRGRISFDGVFFRYSTSPDWVLKDINLSVDPGERVALVGESGAGKSSLVALIPRFYEVTSGVIRIDELEIGLLKQRSLRKHIGIVQQDVFLFDGTIRENIMYGNPRASDRELVEAARQANIYDFIDSLPEGLDTEVGERGVRLSGGQKQRVSIARVFLKDPQILIFDEATSSLDSESEALIQEAMFKLSEHRTTIIIAHRLSTVKNVDRIYVMREGRIVEIGSHTELIEQGGYYHTLYTRNLL
jgi:ATP-binding cassette subfamily B protein